MPALLTPAPPRQRALVVEPDPGIRTRLAALLREYGMDVADCADVTEGRALFADHRLVVAPLNGDNTAMKEFVAWVRAEAGAAQPWIIALGEQHQIAPGETPAHYGVNDLLTGPVDTAALVRTLEALGLGRVPLAIKLPAASPSAPPSYHRAKPSAATLLAATHGWDGASAQVLLEHFPAAVAVLDRTMQYLAVNTRWVQQFQIPRLNLTGRNHYEIFPDLHPDWRALYDRCLAGDEKQTTNDVMLRPDGTEDHVHWEIQPWHEPAGPVGGLVLTCKTIEPPAIQAPLPPAELEPIRNPKSAPDTTFQEMAEAAPFGMILLDDEAHVIYANPQHRAVLGFATEPDEPIQTWLQRACAGDEVFQKRALDEWWESVWRRRTALTCSLRNADGLVEDIEFRPAALSGDRLLLTIFDVTDARLDEQAVRTSEARYRGLFQHASAALLMINPAGNITEVNPAFETLTGLPRHDARRAALGDFLPPEAITRLRDATHASGTAEAFSTVLRDRHNNETSVHVSVAIIRNEQGLPAFTACLFAPLPHAPSSAPWHDITPDWLFLLDEAGTILEHTASRDFLTFQSDEKILRGELLEDALPALCAALPLDVMMERLLDSPGHETRCEYVFTLATDPTPHRLEARLIQLPGPPPLRFGLTLRDVTRARATNAPGGFNITLLETLATAAILTNEKGRILHLNPAAESLLGYVTADLKDDGLYRVFAPETPAEFSKELSHHLQTKRAWHATTPFTRQDGTTAIGTVELTPAVDDATASRGFILLLRPHEVSFAPTPTAPIAPTASISLHRARNDLQVLTSLIALQADHATDPHARTALLACRDRLAAVALIYRLVQHEDSPVDFARFVTEIGRTLLDARPRPDGKITIDPLFTNIFLPQRLSIHLGLIVEELLNASLSWSFPNETTQGHIRLTLTVSNGAGILILRDNGQPLSPALRAQREATFSSHIIQLLAQQIGGTLTLLSDLENQVRLHFRIT